MGRGTASSPLPGHGHTAIPGVSPVAWTPLAAGCSKAGLLGLSLRLRLRCSVPPASDSTLRCGFVLPGSGSAPLELGKATGSAQSGNLSSPYGNGTLAVWHGSSPNAMQGAWLEAEQECAE